MTLFHLERQIAYDLERRRRDGYLRSLATPPPPRRLIARWLRAFADRLEPIPPPLQPTV